MTEPTQLSQEDEEICNCVRWNRIGLSRFLQDFVLATQLFELLERGGGPPSVGVFGGVFIQYRIIAAKEGALCIFHFGNSLSALSKQVYRCPITKGVVDSKKLKVALKLFNKYFPHANNTRHAIAHAGEVWASPLTAREHAQKKDYISHGVTSLGTGGLLFGALYEKTYSVGWKGTVFEVQLDALAIARLTEVSTLAEAAFALPSTAA